MRQRTVKYQKITGIHLVVNDIKFGDIKLEMITIFRLGKFPSVISMIKLWHTLKYPIFSSLWSLSKSIPCVFCNLTSG